MVIGSLATKDRRNQNIANMRPSSARRRDQFDQGSNQTSPSNEKLRTYVNLLVEKGSSPLDIRKVKRRGSLHPIDSKSQYLHVPLLFVPEEHRRTFFHPSASTDP